MAEEVGGSELVMKCREELELDSAREFEVEVTAVGSATLALMIVLERDSMKSSKMELVLLLND